MSNKIPNLSSLWFQQNYIYIYIYISLAIYS